MRTCTEICLLAILPPSIIYFRVGGASNKNSRKRVRYGLSRNLNSNTMNYLTSLKSTINTMNSQPVPVTYSTLDIFRIKATVVTGFTVGYVQGKLSNKN